MLRPSEDLQDLAIVACGDATHNATHDDTHDDIGDVKDLYFDDQAWAIRYLVVSKGNWWKGHEVLVAPQWIQRVSWAERSVAVDLTREALKQAPWYDPASPLSREMEVAVFKHHGRAGYWPGAAPVATPASDRAVSSRTA
jgi:hypothetical protein